MTGSLETGELLDWMMASVRGSLSPSGPGLTAKMTRVAVSPGGGGLTMNSARAAVARKTSVWVDIVPWPVRPVSLSVPVECHDLQRLGHAIILQLHVVEAVG